MGDQRLRADVRRADRRRRAACGHLRAQADLHHRRGDLRRLLAARRRRAGHRLADLLPRADGHRRRDDVAGDPRHDLRGAAGKPRRSGRRADPRRGRHRQRRRADVRRRSDRSAELALDLLRERSDRRVRRARDVAGDPPARARTERSANRLRRRRDALARPRRAARGARSGDRLGLERHADHPAARDLRRDAARLRADRAADEGRRADPARRDRQSRLRDGLPDGADDVGCLLLDAALPAAVHAEDPRTTRRSNRASVWCR